MSNKVFNMVHPNTLDTVQLVIGKELEVLPSWDCYNHFRGLPTRCKKAEIYKRTSISSLEDFHIMINLNLSFPSFFDALLSV